MVNVWVCFYGSDREAALWSDPLTDLRKEGLKTPVFLGSKGRVSHLLSPKEVIAPDNWDTIISEFQPSEEALEEYGRFTGASSFSEVMRNILKTMDRRDYSGTFRSLDQDIVVRILVLFYMTKVSHYAIEGVVFDVLPHTPDSMILYQVAKFLGIPTLAFEQCGLASVRFPVTEFASEKRFFMQQTGLHPAKFRTPATSSRIRRAIESRWEGFGQLDHIEPYIASQRFRARRKRVTSLSKWKSFFSRFGKSNGAVAMTFPGLNWTSRSARALTGWVLEKSWRAALIQSISLSTSPALGPAIPPTNRQAGHSAGSLTKEVSSGKPGAGLFALHYEPESTSFPEGLPVKNQFDAVVEARRLLAPDRELLVKEHPVQALSVNQGYMGRSPFFYSAVRGLRNTRIVPSQVSAKELMASVDVVFTLTGTVAFEGLSLGKQVVHFGSPWWEGCPGTVKTFFGFLPRGSLPNLSQSAVDSSQAEEFILKRVQESGVFYPENSANLDDVVQSNAEISMILRRWLSSLKAVSNGEAR